jgi:hypothetical protein
MHHRVLVGLSVVLVVGCGAASNEPISGLTTGGAGTSGTGGASNPAGGVSNPGTGGASNTGGVSSPATGGASSQATGGASNPATGGVSDPGTGGVGNPETGGSTATGGQSSDTGGTTATGGRSTGGTTATGGRGMGGRSYGGASTASGGRSLAGGGGSTASGGTTSGTGGSTGAGGGSGDVDCSAPMPTGGTDHCGANTQGTAGGLSWSLWSNALNSGSCITTYNATAFSARWSNSGDFLARVGLEWGNGSKTYDQYGTIKAEFSYSKTGSGGGFSYIGIYGWSNNPCVEYYIVEDSFNNFPFNAYNATQKGTATIDGETYKLFQNTTNGTGGSRCSGVSSWSQFWSIRQKARQCGVVSITQHFDAWKAAGMNMGGLLEAKILVEVGGGTGSINFPVANVTAG